MQPAIVTCPNCGKRNRVAPTGEGIPRCANCHQPLPWIAEADAEGFDAAVTATVPVLVDFWAPWCGPCKMITPAVEALAGDNAGRLKVVQLNVDEAPEAASRYGVQGIPLLVVLKDGQEADRLVGAAPPARLREWLEPHLASWTSAKAS